MRKTWNEDSGTRIAQDTGLRKSTKERLRRPWRRSLILRVLGRKDGKQCEAADTRRQQKRSTDLAKNQYSSSHEQEGNMNHPGPVPTDLQARRGVHHEKRRQTEEPRRTSATGITYGLYRDETNGKQIVKCGAGGTETAEKENPTSEDHQQGTEQPAQGNQPRPMRQTTPRREFKGNFGAWIYAILEGINEDEDGNNARGTDTPTAAQNRTPILPRIRTHQVTRTAKEYEPPRRPVPTDQYQARRGATRGRGGRGGAPRRTAAETEHTVVRGRNYGKQIVSTVVVHPEKEAPESSHLEEFNFAFKENPPDVPAAFRNMENLTDESMCDKGGQLDPDDMVMGDLPCS
nr:uncharacterized protein LOC109179535 isoform X2 [Ipomoea batatas]